ncbi:GNAT family acetyltransferase [Desulfocurvus sp. DL9XJH121]
MSGWSIRPYAAEDREGVLALWEACGLTRPWNDPGRDIGRKVADSPGLFLVALDGGRVAGTCMAGYDGHRGWIYYLGVLPDLRGRGLGRALVRQAEEELLAQGCPKVELMVRDSNHQAAGFYLGLGYADEPVRVLSKRLVSDENCRGDE